MNLKERLKRFLEIDLYPVITPELCNDRSVLEMLEAILRGGAKIVQLRDKKDPRRYAKDFRRVTLKYNALLIINDSVETAIEVGADGVHLGQNDMPIKDARRFAPELLIGASTHNLKEALKVQEDGASYINIGPIFETNTKPLQIKPLGINAIKEIAPHLKIPFTVMGGIKKENIREVLAAGAKRTAMVTALTQAEDIEKETKEIIDIICFSLSALKHI